jgi:hypothetical protein
MTRISIAKFIEKKLFNILAFGLRTNPVNVTSFERNNYICTYHECSLTLFKPFDWTNPVNGQRDTP